MELSQALGTGASPLPEGAFRTRAFQAEEDAAIWTRAWVAIGFAADAPGPGDVLPFTVGNHGVHVERLANGSLAGRFNKAQHGGCRAVPLQCQTGAKTKCSFTACGYSRDRRPIAASEVGRESQLDQYLGLRPERLLSVAVQVYGPLIAVQLDPSRARDFAWPTGPNVAAPAAAPGSAGTRWIEVGANWKLVAAAFAGPGAFASGERDHACVSGPRARASVLFPNVVLVEEAAATCAIILQPTALDRTLCRVRALRAPDVAAGGRAIDRIMDAAATCAEAWACGSDGSDAVTPLRRWFDGKVCRAVDRLRGEQATGPLYRTDDKGGW